MQELLSLSDTIFNQHVTPIYSYALGPCVGSDQFLDSNDWHICKRHFSCVLTIDPRCKFASADDYSPKPFPCAMRRPSSGWKCSQPWCWWEQGGDSITLQRLLLLLGQWSCLLPQHITLVALGWQQQPTASSLPPAQQTLRCFARAPRVEHLALTWLNNPEQSSNGAFHGTVIEFLELSHSTALKAISTSTY